MWDIFLYHSLYPEIFKAGSTFLDWQKGGINTVVLLISSFTMALGIYFAPKNKMKACRMSLILTLLCGLLFMLIKYVEYSHKMHVGYFPGEVFYLYRRGKCGGLGTLFFFLLLNDWTACKPCSGRHGPYWMDALQSL